MGQEDLFKKQLDQLALLLGKTLTTILQLREKPGINISEQSFKTIREELNLDVNELLLEPSDKLINLLKDNYGYQNEHLNILSEIFYETACLLYENGEIEKAKLVFERALILFEFENKTKKDLALERIFKIQKINRLLI